MKNNTISSLAKSRVTYNRSRSVLTVIAITLTTTLLMGLVTSALGIFDMQRQQALADGNHHATIRHLTTKQVEMLRNHLDVESLEAVAQFATIRHGNIEGYLTASSVLKEGIYHGSDALTEGRFPESPDEICGPPAFFECMGAEPAIGAKIAIPFRVGGEGFIQTREFTICGLAAQRDLSSLEIGDHRLSYSASVSEALVEEYLSPGQRDYNAVLRLSGEDSLTEKALKEQIHDLCLNIGGDTENISYNMPYLMTMLEMSAEMTAGVAAIGLLILFFSALVIYSIYYVSVITDVQEIGKLKALGASKKQIKHLLVSESMRLCAIAVPAGLFLGAAIPYALFPAVMKAVEKHSPLFYAVENCRMFSLPAFIGVIAAILATVRISLWKPLRMAGKISPIEAIRYQESAAKAGARKGFRNVNLFRLSLSGLARNKKRTIVTIMTMGLSCVLFMSLAGVGGSMTALDYARHSIPEGSFRLYLDCEWNDREYPENNFDALQTQNLFGDSLTQKIRAIDGVTDIGKSAYVLFDTDSSAPLFENRKKKSIAPVSRANAEALQKDLTEGEIDYDRMLAENGVICTTYLDWEDMGLSIGEPIELTIHDGDQEIPLTVKVCAVVKASMHGYFILPKELWDSLHLQYDPTCELHISVEQDKYEEVKASLSEIAAENGHFYLYSLDEELQLGRMSVIIVKYPLYAILIMVAVIGCINLINTMITSIVTRKKEFGILQAIGLSDRQLKKMLSMEGLFFTAGTLFLSVTLGNFFGYLAFLCAKKAHLLGLNAYHYPLRETLGLAAMLIGGQLLITGMMNRQAHRESLIDRIRSGE